MNSTATSHSTFRRTTAAVLLATAALACIVTADARAVYHPRLGRFLQRDPIGYADGMGLYEYGRSSPSNQVDPRGLWIGPKREGQPRAAVCCEAGDTWQELAQKIRLDVEERHLWAQAEGGGEVTDPPTPGKVYTVPNTAYIDVSSYSWGFLGWYLIAVRVGVQGDWEGEGLRVEYNGIWKVTKGVILSHLGDQNLYKYCYIGHGAAGTLTRLSNPDPEPNDESPGIIAGDKYTKFGIAEMRTYACHTNMRAWAWKKNVSSLGRLLTIKGIATFLRFMSDDDDPRVWQSGE